MYLTSAIMTQEEEKIAEYVAESKKAISWAKLLHTWFKYLVLET